MTSLEEFYKVNTEYIRTINNISNTGVPSNNTANSLITLNVILSSYLPSIAKSLAIIADKMSEKDKED